MRGFRLLCGASVAVLIISPLWADTVPTALSVSTPLPTYTPEVFTSTTPMMTQRSGEPLFFSLTRGPFPASKLPTSAESFGPQDIFVNDAQNVGEALARQTSFETFPIGHLGSPLMINVRGAPSPETLVMIDGRPVSGVSLNSPDLTEIPVENIDHIEILRGGASALYGPNAVGGVVNIITQRATYPGHPVSHFSYENRSYSNQIYRLNFGSRAGPLDYYFYGDQQWESGFRDNSDNRSHNIGGNFGLSLGKAGKLLFDASSYHIAGGVSGPDLNSKQPIQFNDQDEKLSSTPGARQINDTNYLRTSYLLPLSENTVMALRLFRSQRQADYVDISSSTRVIQQSNGGELQFNLPHGFTAGGSFIRDREDNTDRLVSTNTVIAGVENWGLFVQEDVRWQSLTLIPSGRYDHHSQAGESLSPRLQILYDAAPWLRFSGSGGRSFRAPTLDELYGLRSGFQGNPFLQNEKAWTFDAGWEIHQDSDSIRATYFLANVSDLIQLTADQTTVINTGRAHRQGMELQVEQVFNPRVRHRLNYTYLQNLIIPTGSIDSVDAAYSPRHTVNYIFTLMPASRWRVDSTLRYVDPRFSGNNRTGTKLSSYLLCGLRLQYQLRQMDLFLGVNNVTNKRYEEQAGFPLPGRTVNAGLQLKLWD